MLAWQMFFFFLLLCCSVVHWGMAGWVYQLYSGFHLLRNLVLL
jgi:hypothetical protein